MRDTTPDTLVVTGNRAEFFEQLEHGDVLLFQGADFLAGLAQLTERRTCYHSAIYLGIHEGADGEGEHLLAHNVSSLWWRDLAALPGPGGTRVKPPPGVDLRKDPPALTHYLEQLTDNLATHHLRSATATTPEQRHQAAANLVERGGVGVVSVDGYLDRLRYEQLYGRRDRPRKQLHHIRSTVALRHRSLVGADQADLRTAGSRLMEASGTVAAAASGFNAAELLSVVPDCFARPGYTEAVILELIADVAPNVENLGRLFGLAEVPAGASARELLRRRLRTVDPVVTYPESSGPGWICASYVIAAYAEAGLPLEVETVEGVELDGPDGTVPLSTPRDLWDCPDLVPVALFARGPERWEDEPSSDERPG